MAISLRRFCYLASLHGFYDVTQTKLIWGEYIWTPWCLSRFRMKNNVFNTIHDYRACNRKLTNMYNIANLYNFGPYTAMYIHKKEFIEVLFGTLHIQRCQLCTINSAFSTLTTTTMVVLPVRFRSRSHSCSGYPFQYARSY